MLRKSPRSRFDEIVVIVDAKEAVGRIRLPDSILSVQKSAVGDTLYWTAMSQVSRGDAGTAAQTLRNYRRQYPDEKMKYPSLLLEAELLLELGDAAGAAAILKESVVEDNPELARQAWLLSRIAVPAAPAADAPPAVSETKDEPAAGIPAETPSQPTPPSADSEPKQP